MAHFYQICFGSILGLFLSVDDISKNIVVIKLFEKHDL